MRHALEYLIGGSATLVLLAGAAVFAAPGDGSTGNGIIQGDRTSGKAITPSSVTTTGAVTAGGGAYGCSGSCPAWGHAPTLACEGAAEIDGVLYCDGGTVGCTTLSSDLAPTLGADLNLGVYDLLNGDDWYTTPATTDVAPSVKVISTQAPLVSAATVRPTNTTGASLVAQPSGGDRRLTVLNPAGAATVTLQSQTNGVLNTARTLVVGTICAAGGLTVAQCACLIYDALVATPAVGIATPTRLDGTCSNGVLAFAVTPGAASYMTIATTAAGVVSVNSGTDGQILHPAGTEALPGISFALYPNMGWRAASATTAALSIGGVNALYCINSNCYGASNFQASNVVGSVSVQNTASNLTAGTMVVNLNSFLLGATHKFSWTNAMVAALGASATGDIAVATLPAKNEVIDAEVIIDTACTAAGTLSVAVGRTGAAYIDYIVASDAKAAANTIYGNDTAERGANLTGYDLPSWTGTTTIYAHFVSGTGNLDAVTTCTGHVILTTRLLM